MRFRFDRTTIIFIIFLLILGGIFGANQFVQNQPPLEITVAVDPLAVDWVQAAAQAYNNSKPLIANGTVRVQVTVTTMSDLNVWHGNPNWNGTNHPNAWIASSSASMDYLPPTLAFHKIQDSLARTPLVWGSFDSRLTWLTANGSRPFDWSAVQEIAVAQRWSTVGIEGDSSFVNMAFLRPNSSMAGFGAVMSAAGNFGQTTSLDNTLLDSSEFKDWFTPINDAVANALRIGGNPAQTMASRGTSVADFALLPESQWLLAYDELNKNGGVSFAYPAYQFVLDFPMARWQDPQTNDNELAAVTSFASYLSGTEGQALTVQYGLRPANSEPDASASLFAKAQDKGIQLEPDYGQMMDVPARTVADLLFNLVG